MEVKETLGLPIVTDVHEASQVGFASFLHVFMCCWSCLLSVAGSDICSLIFCIHFQTIGAAGLKFQWKERNKYFTSLKMGNFFGLRLLSARFVGCTETSANSLLPTLLLYDLPCIHTFRSWLPRWTIPFICSFMERFRCSKTLFWEYLFPKKNSSITPVA